MSNEIVLNASPIILFSKTGYFHVLRKLFDKMYIPRVVVQEIAVDASNETATVLKEDGIVVHCNTQNNDKVISWDLGIGETGVISFALANPAVRPVLGDAEAKACCLSLGIKPLGTGSVLILAKRAGLLPSVKTVLLEMRSKGMWISDAVVDSISSKAGG
ncbi:MAG: DUF3368 domain-containing protein [Spirochaetota bacterium]